jgi:hypothetical protein
MLVRGFFFIKSEMSLMLSFFLVWLAESQATLLSKPKEGTMLQHCPLVFQKGQVKGIQIPVVYKWVFAFQDETFPVQNMIATTLSSSAQLLKLSRGCRHNG